jgi:sugar/nucleoside kinase (ribokinase family)
MSDELLEPGLQLCVVGNLNRDIKLAGVPPSPALFEDGETSAAGVIETVGGGGANSACAAAALGASVRFVGKVGADALGERLQRTLEEFGVRTSLKKDASCATGNTVALGFTSGHRHFLSHLPNNESLRLEDLDLAALDGCTHLLRADVWFSQSMLEGGNQRLFAEARRRGLITSLDINFDPHWSSAPRDVVARRKRLVRDVLPLVDLAHGNERELCEFTDSSDLKTALRCLTEWGVKSVVIHLGARGAGYFCDGELTIEPPSPAEKPVHATGTGDVLSVCMILQHSRADLSVREKLRRANRIVCDFMEGRRTLIPSL